MQTCNGKGIISVFHQTNSLSHRNERVSYVLCSVVVEGKCFSSAINKAVLNHLNLKRHDTFGPVMLNVHYTARFRTL